MGRGRCPYGQQFQPRKTKPFSLWAPKSFITQIAKNASSSPALPNLLYICIDYPLPKMFDFFFQGWLNVQWKKQFPQTLQEISSQVNLRSLVLTIFINSIPWTPASSGTRNIIIFACSNTINWYVSHKWKVLFARVDWLAQKW